MQFLINTRRFAIRIALWRYYSIDQDDFIPAHILISVCKWRASTIFGIERNFTKYYVWRGIKNRISSIAARALSKFDSKR